MLRALGALLLVAAIVQPFGAAAEAPLQPTGALVELSNEHEKFVSLSIDTSGKSDDGTIEIVDRYDVWERSYCWHHGRSHSSTRKCHETCYYNQYYAIKQC